MQHCEEPALTGGSMHAGLVCTALGLAGIPAEAEQLMIARDLLLNRTIGCRYHVQHISTAWSVELIRRAKRDGQTWLTAEVSPHHLLLTDEILPDYDTNYKMNPPLRTARRCERLHRRRERRHDRHPRHRSRAASGRGKGTGIPLRAVRHHRDRMRPGPVHQSPGRARPHRLDEADRPDEHAAREDRLTRSRHASRRRRSRM